MPDNTNVEAVRFANEKVRVATKAPSNRRPTANTPYVLEVTAVQGSANGFRRLEFIAGYHGA